MKLLLFGGTFDPPHLGHLQLLQSAIETVLPDKVVLMPSAQPPHKPRGQTPAHLRLAMCACFAPLFKNLELSELEIKRGGKSYTVDTVKTLVLQNPNAQIYLCIGSDMLLSFTSWHNYEELLQLTVLVAHARNNGEADALQNYANTLVALGGKVLISNGIVLPLSSSKIRLAASKGETIENMVSPLVLNIILQNKLYLP